VSFPFTETGLASEVQASPAGFDAVVDQALGNARALELALGAMPVGVSWASLEDQSIRFMNQKFTEIFGYKLGDFSTITEWITKAYPFAEDRALAMERWGARLAAPHKIQSVVESIELRILCKDGKLKTILNSGVVLPENGWALATFVDITNRKEYELRLKELEREARESESIYRLLLDHSPEMIILAPSDDAKRYVSPAVEKITGYTAKEYLSMTPPMMIHPDDRERATRVIRSARDGVAAQVFRYRTMHKNGSHRWVEATITGYVEMASEQGCGYIATIRDISEQKEREDKLAIQYLELSELASVDELTGIANRRSFNQMVQAECSRQTRSTCNLSVLLLELDYFKQYNDYYGHLPGDLCLQKVATALKNCLRRGGDLAARFGNEEFAALLPLTDLAGAQALAQIVVKAVGALAIPHAGSPHGVVTISVGVACSPTHLPLDQADLLADADRALDRAKAASRNRYRLGLSPGR
jgi:diguanylate cyclase (GGDEF)-like protein/PAS domain S-box-containing protein